MNWLIRFLRAVEYGVYIMIFSVLLVGSVILIPSTTGGAARRFTRPYEFDFVSWTLDAFSIKWGQFAIDTPFYFSENARHKIVVDYLHVMDSILEDENKLSMIYSDPSITNPQNASLSLRSELAGLYYQQKQLSPMAESVLQEQVSSVLTEIGLNTAGQSIPPVLFHLTPLPYDLIISPREKIQEDSSISLVPDLTVDKQVSLENQVDKALNVSSLVVPVGGIGTYPTMIERTTDLNWLIETIAHEWTHNWLTLRPLGLNYDSSQQVRSMNETTADISGTEISRLVLQRYYPELFPQLGGAMQANFFSSASQDEGFNFRVAMHTTRVHVDELLAAGKIADAESYMEQRRQYIWSQGCGECFIRKLNQAYFAFYGAYADIPGGAAGEDPVGPAVRALRAQSRSLVAFLNSISRMSSFKQLQNALTQ